MDITEVRIKLVDHAGGGDRLQAFCSITFDDAFVIRDLKIIEGAHGPFVAMPSRKLTSRCPQCGCKNHLRAGYCNQCGLRLRDDRVPKDDSGRAKLYADIAHPINSHCREMIQMRIVQEFHAELERSKQPGYVSKYDDYDLEEEFAQPAEPLPSDAAMRRTERAPHVSSITKVEPPEAPRGPHSGAAKGAPGKSSAANGAGAPHRPPQAGNFGAGIL